MEFYGWPFVISAIAFLVILVSFGMFWRLLKSDGSLTASDRVAAWDVFAKVITTLAAIVAGLFAFLQYLDQRELELAAQQFNAAQKVREFNIAIYGESKSFDHGKLVFLNEVADLGATLATLDDLKSPIAIISLDRFERLYHGQLCLYEDPDVEKAMINFRDALHKWKRTRVKPTALLPEERTHGEKLDPVDERKNSDFMRRLALRLSLVCKEQIRKLPPPPATSQQTVK